VNLLEPVVRWLLHLFGIAEKWSQLSPDTQMELKLMVSIFLGNVIASILGTVFVGLIVYLIVHRHQNRTMQEERELNRLTLLDNLEDNINELYKSKVVSYSEEVSSEDDLFHLGTCFNPVYNWNQAYENDHLDSAMINGQRFWNVSSQDNIWLASSAFQDSLLWFRKLYRGYGQGLIDGSDVHILWRHIVPFVLSYHYVAFEAFFSVTDLKPLREMAVVMTDYAHNEGKTELFKHFSDIQSNQAIDPLFEERVDGYFQKHYDKTLTEIANEHIEAADMEDVSEVPVGARA